MLSRNTIEEEAFLGVASDLNGICKVKPLTIKEIYSIGVKNYYSKLGMLLLNESNIQAILKEQTGKTVPLEQINPLNYLLQNASLSDDFWIDFTKTLELFIPNEEILLLPKIDSILIGKPDDKRLINKQNYNDLVEILMIQNNRELPEPPPENESEIARSFRLKREARDLAKKKQQEKKGETQSFLDTLVVAETFGIDVENKTLFAFYKLLERHRAREKWDNDLQMLCAGADNNKIKTKYWGGNLKNE